LAIVGDGAERAALRARAGDLEARGIVTFVGALPYDDSLRWFEWAHALVLPSQHSEGWPKVVAEGMCHGLLCIAVAHGQVPSMLNGRGVLLPTGSPEEIAQALREVARDPAGQQPVMRAASAWARQFSLEGLRSALATLLANRWNLPAPAAAAAADLPPSLLGPEAR
jgi:glycosyltransferase involved in cell wall biosynthesis